MINIMDSISLVKNRLFRRYKKGENDNIVVIDVLSLLVNP